MNDELEKELQAELRTGENDLDAATLAKLHAARNLALAAGEPIDKKSWFGGWAPVAAAASAAAIAVLLLVTPDPGVDPDGVDPDDMLPSSLTGTARIDNGVGAPVDPADGSENDISDTEALMLAELESTLLFAAEGGVLPESRSDENLTEPTADEMLELLENLDFYEWLSDEELAEQAS